MAKPPLGEQQLNLLKYIADNAPVSVRNVTDRYGEDHGLARTTVLTMMERLRAKGYLTRKKQNGVLQYSPAVTGSEMWQGVVEQFVERTLGGSVAPFVAYLTKTKSLSEVELEALRKFAQEIGLDEGKL